MFHTFALSVFNTLLLTLIPPSSSIDANCDLFQNVVLGQEYFIYNREYPNFYRPQTSCRWTAKSPPGTIIVLSCNDFNIPPSQNCQNDRLSVSRTGDGSFQNAQNLCGNYDFTIYSEANAMTIGLFAGQGGGGRFSCSLAAMRLETWCSCSVQIEEEKIVGGQETKIHGFPWMSALLDVTTYENYCGASIISNRYAVTAAHCLVRYTANIVGLLVGDHNLATGNDTAAAALYKISNFIIHPSYNDRGDRSSDIGLVKTLQQIFFSPAVGPVCLPFRYGFWTFENYMVTVLGWGFRDISGYKSDTLQKVNLSVVSNSRCAQSMPERIHLTQICTYTPGKDACLSDSGGPLLWKEGRGRRYELVGVVSYGISCAANTPGVNTRVTSFLAWIASVTGDAAFCIR